MARYHTNEPLFKCKGCAAIVAQREMLYGRSGNDTGEAWKCPNLRCKSTLIKTYEGHQRGTPELVSGNVELYSGQMPEGMRMHHNEFLFVYG